MTVLFLIMFVLVSAALMRYAVFPLFRRHEAASQGAPEIRPVEPKSLESVLVAQMMAGEISPRQYQHAVERIAARDDERHPMAIPPEIGHAGS